MSWKDIVKPKSGDNHKYDYGQLIIYSGHKMTGAASLAGISALRMGVGLVTIVSPPDAADIYRGFCPSLIVEELDETAHFERHLTDPRRNAILIGPGAGHDNKAGLKHAILDSLASGKICLLDADALTVFEDDPSVLIKKLHAKSILTPHEGEFVRLFPEIKGNKTERCAEAAKQSGSVVLIKGAETVIAAPDGRCEVISNGSPWLATAGSGDVLAGMIAGFAAWHTDHLFEAVCAAVYMHGAASKYAGAGMISSDIPDYIAKVWQNLPTEL